LGARVVTSGKDQLRVNADVFGMWEKMEFGWIEYKRCIYGCTHGAHRINSSILRKEKRKGAKVLILQRHPLGVIILEQA
jgi:hypothetical protein